MDDRAALIAAIHAEPDDLLPRLVFADWLDDHGEGSRAAWMRASCEPGAEVPGSAARRRADALFAACRPGWWVEAARYAPTAARGMIELRVVSDSPARLFGHAGWVRDAINGGWVESILAADCLLEVARWAEPLRSMPLQAILLDHASNEALVVALGVPNLRTLVFSGQSVELPAVRRLGERADLRQLIVEAFGSEPDAALVFSQFGRMTGLTHLALRSLPRLADTHLAALTGLTRLVWLELAHCPCVTDAGLAELRRALPKVEVVRQW